MSIQYAQNVAVALPRPGSPVTIEQMEDAEHAIALCLPMMDDIREIEEQRDKIAALETYLKGKQAHLPARGAQRRLEARIGQLLGEAQVGRPENGNVTHAENIDRPADRHDFRVLSRALDGQVELTKDEWRQSRRALVKLIKERTPEPENMEAAEATIDMPRGNRVVLADERGMEEAIRHGMEREASGEAYESVAKSVGISVHYYRKACDVVFLHDRGGYSAVDAKLVDRAWRMLVEDARVVEARETIKPVAEKVWGTTNDTRPRADREPARHDKFDYAFGLVMQACEDAAEMDLPYLSEDAADAALKQLAQATRHLRRLTNRITEIHS